MRSNPAGCPKGTLLEIIWGFPWVPLGFPSDSCESSGIVEQTFVLRELVEIVDDLITLFFTSFSVLF
jgi:hypothetical protein